MVTRRRRARGVTLIELMTVMTIAVVLAMVAVPSFTKLAASQRLRTAATNLQQALMLARSEGLKRNANVTVGPPSGVDWAVGWVVKEASSGTVLSTFPSTPSLAITGPASVTYQSSGRIDATTSASFKVSSASIADVRCVTIGVTGLPSVATSGC